MKRISLLLLLATSLLLSSCGASKFFSSNAASIRPIALVEPFSYLTDAIADWSTDYVEGPSQVNQKLVSEIMGSIGLPIEKVIPFTYNYTERGSSLVAWMRQLADVNPGAATNLVVPGELRDAVRTSGCRYGMVISDVGFVKNAKELATERAIETGTRILDFIFNNEVDLSSSEAHAYTNGVFSLIFDNQTGSVVWYGSQPRKEKVNPMERTGVQEQILKLYAAFL